MKAEKLESDTAKMVSKAIWLVRSQEKQPREETPEATARRKQGVLQDVALLNEFKKLIERRNEILHSDWLFPQTRADPRDDPDTTDILEAAVYDHRSDSWKDRQMTFNELEETLAQAESIRKRLGRFRWLD